MNGGTCFGLFCWERKRISKLMPVVKTSLERTQKHFKSHPPTYLILLTAINLSMSKLMSACCNYFSRALIAKKRYGIVAQLHSSLISNYAAPRRSSTRHQIMRRIVLLDGIKNSAIIFRNESSFARGYEGDEISVDVTSSADQSLSKPFILTDIGEGIFEVEILQWYVNEGDDIEQFQKVCEVQSDKATVDITSRYDGKVEKLCGAQGDMVEVGSPLMFINAASDGTKIEDGNESSNVEEGYISESADNMATDNLRDEESYNLRDEESFEIPNVGVEKGSNSKVFASPAVRRLSMENGLNLTSIHGSGKDGRVLKSDIVQLLNEHNEESMNTLSMESTENQPTKKSLDEVISIRGYNRIMVNAMEKTLQVPHMVYSDEVDMSALRQCRLDMREMAERKGVSISYLPFAVKACSLAMKEIPILNSSIDTEEMTLTLHASHHIGVAIDSPKGLVVPVIRNCQEMSVLDIAVEMKRLRDLVCKFVLFFLNMCIVKRYVINVFLYLS